jgi:hypothetical protein
LGLLAGRAASSKTFVAAFTKVKNPQVESHTGLMGWS